MNDSIDIIKSLQNLGVLIDGVTESVKHEMSFVSTFSRFISATINFFSGKRYKWKRS